MNMNETSVGELEPVWSVTRFAEVPAPQRNVLGYDSALALTLDERDLHTHWQNWTALSFQINSTALVIVGDGAGTEAANVPPGFFILMPTVSFALSGFDSVRAEATSKRASEACILRELERDAQETTEWAGDCIAITRRPDRCGGAPTIAGTRVTVHDVVSHARHYGGDLERVRCEVLTHVSREELEAAMAFYAKHAEEIDALLARQQAVYEQLPVAPRGW